MDTASLPNVLIMCSGYFFSSIWIYIASLEQEVCVIMDVFPRIACSEERYSFPGFSCAARMFVQQKSFCG